MNVHIFMVGLGCWILAACQVSAKKDLVNDGFENPSVASATDAAVPEGWKVFSSTEKPCAALSSLKKKNGSQALRFTSHFETNNYTGYAQTVEVKPKRRYEFSVYARNDETEPMSNGRYGQISMEWKTADGQEIGREYGPTWSSGLSVSKWERFAVEGTAPDNAAQCSVVINSVTTESGAKGVCFVDKAEFVQKP